MKNRNDDGDPDPPSKSQRKRDHRQLQLLAESLAALPDKQFRNLALDEHTREEMLLLRGMSASGARNRQIRRIAKLLEEGNIAELQQPLIENDASRRAATALHHRAERLRERLLAADDGAFAELAPDAPEAIVARLRALCALARDPGGGNRSRQANRDIYRLLLELSAPGSGT